MGFLRGLGFGPETPRLVGYELFPELLSDDLPRLCQGLGSDVG